MKASTASLGHYLFQFSFMAYFFDFNESNITPPNNKIILEPNQENCNFTSNSILSKISVTFCVEGQCIIIKDIDINIINSIISVLKDNGVLLIDVGMKQIDFNDTKQKKKKKIKYKRRN